MRQYDAIVMIGGSHRGWVGYFLREEGQEGFLVRLFSSEGNVHELTAYPSDVQCVEPRMTRTKIKS